MQLLLVLICFILAHALVCKDSPHLVLAHEGHDHQSSASPQELVFNRLKKRFALIAKQPQAFAALVMSVPSSEIVNLAPFHVERKKFKKHNVGQKLKAFGDAVNRIWVKRNVTHAEEVFARLVQWLKLNEKGNVLALQEVLLAGAVIMNKFESLYQTGTNANSMHPSLRAYTVLMLALDAYEIYLLNVRANGKAQFALNHLSVLTPEETFQFKGYVRNETSSSSSSSSSNRQRRQLNVDEEQQNKRILQTLPTNFDWRQNNAVGPVLNQYQCGGCWAFAATQVLQTNLVLKKYPLLALSQQQLIDCSTANDGCDGGNFESAWQYVARSPAGNVGGQSAYPFTSVNGAWGPCQTQIVQASNSIGDISAINTFGSVQQESYMPTTLYENGAIAIAICTPNCFEKYSSGVLDQENCDACASCDVDSIDHAVTVIGYGVSQTSGAFWTVKNSWATSWGDDGYVFFARNTQSSSIPYGMCNMMYEASFIPLVSTSPCQSSNLQQVCSLEVTQPSGGPYNPDGSGPGSGDSSAIRIMVSTTTALVFLMSALVIMDG